eukprot:TRINITY_DN5005_c0_g1_i1.p1 TRINITY_DN5005_c0_g1~~TRINITY_DN5005_c0_g1_i1.p1  ORF type:complete len:311 (+),score=53.05 TRINITY_DN5005_c0_g1_i1:23-934(+)
MSHPVDAPKEVSVRPRVSSSHPNKVPLNAKDVKTCRSIIKGLAQHKHGWPFSEPVDPIKLDIPDYFEIIKNPMDFGTIQKRLDRNYYSTPEQVQSDVHLVFNNATTYNPPGNDICLMVDELRTIFDRKWAAAKFQGNSTSPAVPSEKTNKTPVKSESRPSSETPTSQPRTPQNSSVTPTNRKRKTEDGTPKARIMQSGRTSKQMTFEEKKLLGEKINLLPANHLGKVVDIIRSGITKVEHDQLANEENIEIDMEELDISTLRKLDHYVNTSLEKLKLSGHEAGEVNPGESVESKQPPLKKKKE